MLGFINHLSTTIAGCGNDAQFKDFCNLINRPELAEAIEYKTNEDRVKNRVELLKVSLHNEVHKYFNYCA